MFKCRSYCGWSELSNWWSVFLWGKNLPGVFQFPQSWFRIFLAHLAVAFLNKQQVFCSVHKRTWAPLVDYDDVSYDSTTWSIYFLSFGQVWIYFLFFSENWWRSQRKVERLFFKDWILSLAHHSALTATSLSLCFSYNHLELWERVELFQWNQVSERPHGNLTSPLANAGSEHTSRFACLNMAQQLLFKDETTLENTTFELVRRLYSTSRDQSLLLS